MRLIDLVQERAAMMISSSSSGYAGDGSGDPPGGAALVPVVVSATILTQTTPAGRTPFGIELVFNTQMDPASALNLANYHLLEALDSTGTPQFKPLPLEVAFNPALQSVTLLWREKAEFPLGGLLTVIGTPPDGLMDRTGVPLAGADNGAIGTNATYMMLPNALGLVQQ
jgi:hypothetical protein